MCLIAELKNKEGKFDIYKTREKQMMTNIAQIVKGWKKGTRMWSPIFGDCEFCSVLEDNGEIISIVVQIVSCKLYCNFNQYGRFILYGLNDEVSPFDWVGEDCECLLFKSKEDREW